MGHKEYVRVASVTITKIGMNVLLNLVLFQAKHVKLGLLEVDEERTKRKGVLPSLLIPKVGNYKESIKED